MTSLVRVLVAFCTVTAFPSSIFAQAPAGTVSVVWESGSISGTVIGTSQTTASTAGTASFSQGGDDLPTVDYSSLNPVGFSGTSSGSVTGTFSSLFEAPAANPLLIVGSSSGDYDLNPPAQVQVGSVLNVEGAIDSFSVDPTAAQLPPNLNNLSLSVTATVTSVTRDGLGNLVSYDFTGHFVFRGTLAATANESCDDGIDNDENGLIDIDDPDCFTWPIDPMNSALGHLGPCLAWPKDPSGCFWLANSTEDPMNTWRDEAPFQLHEDNIRGKVRFHLGADYNLGAGAFDRGLHVFPAAVGKVVAVLSNQCAWGNIVFVRHETSFGTFTSMYAHVTWLDSGPPTGEVTPRHPIAKVGNGKWTGAGCNSRDLQRGDSYADHLHFELREGDGTTVGLGYSPNRMLIGPQGQIDPNAFISGH